MSADKLADALREIQVVAVDADLRATTHRTALETIARKAREALVVHATPLAAPPAQGEWVMVPRVLPFAVLGEAGMAGVFETGNPKHGWDFLLSKVGKSPQPLTDDYIEQHIGPDEDDREAVTAVVREVERAHGIAAAPQPAPAPVQVGEWEVKSMAFLADSLEKRGDDLSTDAASWLRKFSGAHPPAPAADGAGELPPLPELPPIRSRREIEHYATTYARAAIAALAQQRGSDAVREFTTGHCKNNAQPGGCPLHNLQCGYPACDRRPIAAQQEARS